WHEEAAAPQGEQAAAEGGDAERCEAGRAPVEQLRAGRAPVSAAERVQHLHGEGEVGVRVVWDDGDAAVGEVDLRGGEMVGQAVPIVATRRCQRANESAGKDEETIEQERE